LDLPRPDADQEEPCTSLTDGTRMSVLVYAHRTPDLHVDENRYVADARDIIAGLFQQQHLGPAFVACDPDTAEIDARRRPHTRVAAPVPNRTMRSRR
jgi:hypothetical protein